MTLSDLRAGDRYVNLRGQRGAELMVVSYCMGIYQDERFIRHVPVVDLKTGALLLLPPTHEVFDPERSGVPIETKTNDSPWRCEDGPPGAVAGPNP